MFLFSLFLLTIFSAVLRLLIRGKPSSNMLLCGLFGYVGKDPVDVLRLSWLASENQSRGDDATGVYGSKLFKSTLAAKSFILTSEYREAVSGSRLVLGHTRKATMGAKSKENAHPFDVTVNNNRVIGTHNGMIFEYIVKKFTEELKLPPSDVDSEFIYKMIAHYGFDYDEALSRIEGAMALAFVRPEFPDHLYLYHRLSRPLNVGFLGRNMYYSSESEPLHLIGCEAIDSLADDHLYVFKNGGLLEVSPVKKPFITSIKEDESLTQWLNTRATMEEKRAIGVSGAPAKALPPASPGRQTAMFNQGTGNRQKGKNGKTGTAGTVTRQSTTIGDLVIFNQLSATTFKDLVDPIKARWYEAGDPSACYLIIQLLDTRDKTKVLPAWMVRVAGHPELSALSSYNGIAAIAVPYMKCGDPLELEVVCPLKPDVVYKTTIHKPISGRVLEVALSIPFPHTQTQKEADQADFVWTPSSNTNSNGEDARNNYLSSFSEFLALGRYSEPDIRNVQKQSFGVFTRIERGYAPVCFMASSDCGSTVNEDGKEPFYTDETNILNMNRYDVMTNIDEIDSMQNRLEDLMAEPDPDINEVRSLMSTIQNYFVYLGGYLKDRADFDDKKEQEDEEVAYG